jgi:site-specific DNA-methyltransferase (adenine-specific)
MKRQGEASQDRRYTDNGSTNFAATPGARRIDSGSAARFFYCAKSSRREKNKGVPPGPDGKPGNNHPTVKPVALMRWLVRLVTPPGGTVLDPFAGSGTTGVAATLENFNAILMDMDPHNSDITRHRVNAERDLFTQGVE